MNLEISSLDAYMIYLLAYHSLHIENDVLRIANEFRMIEDIFYNFSFNNDS